MVAFLPEATGRGGAVPNGAPLGEGDAPDEGAGAGDTRRGAGATPTSVAATLATGAGGAVADAGRPDCPTTSRVGATLGLELEAATGLADGAGPGPGRPLKLAAPGTALERGGGGSFLVPALATATALGGGDAGGPLTSAGGAATRPRSVVGCSAGESPTAGSDVYALPASAFSATSLSMIKREESSILMNFTPIPDGFSVADWVGSRFQTTRPTPEMTLKSPARRISNFSNVPGGKGAAVFTKRPPLLTSWE